MNARVDPESLRTLPENGEDADLIALCKVALRALEKEGVLIDERTSLEDRHYKELPPYPALEQIFCEPSGPRHTSTRLREALKSLGAEVPQFWRAQMRSQITAVTAWERQGRALRRSLGIAKAERRCRQAKDLVRRHIGALRAMPAHTPHGAGFKAMVTTCYLQMNCGFDDLGDEIVYAVVEDVRRIAIADGGKRRRAA